MHADHARQVLMGRISFVWYCRHAAMGCYNLTLQLFHVNINNCHFVSLRCKRIAMQLSVTFDCSRDGRAAVLAAYSNGSSC
jgi:hypothetical protein